LLTARREGEQEIQDGQRILDDINNEVCFSFGNPFFFAYGDFLTPSLFVVFT
jgi:hypothetical protein